MLKELNVTKFTFSSKLIREINWALCQKERISKDELKARLRVLGYFDITKIEVAYLEVSGHISVKPRSEK
ncbi:DUF421 domain-containing protein [Neobacillus cucumis]|uniref:YetF domain-containing protein n=1 Tax=Neobacillus cucumis TaxID=1740721 RepID=UPI0018DEF9F3|nr:YetF domain-containing protein [Neobacillus cucumis]MBI0580899.1 DUF421 domain-containing protein [Neobacillus cucumis]